MQACGTSVMTSYEFTTSYSPMYGSTNLCVQVKIKYTKIYLKYSEISISTLLLLVLILRAWKKMCVTELLESVLSF